MTPNPAFSLAYALHLLAMRRPITAIHLDAIKGEQPGPVHTRASSSDVQSQTIPKELSYQPHIPDCLAHHVDLSYYPALCNM
jgi:hypothetical protein